jgi:hypothetical protein
MHDLTTEAFAANCAACALRATHMHLTALVGSGRALAAARAAFVRSDLVSGGCSACWRVDRTARITCSTHKHKEGEVARQLVKFGDCHPAVLRRQSTGLCQGTDL